MSESPNSFDQLWMASHDLLRQQKAMYGSVFEKAVPSWGKILKKFLGQPIPDNAYRERDLPQPLVLGTERDQRLAALKNHGISRSRKLAIDLPYADGTYPGGLQLTGYWQAELQGGLPQPIAEQAQLLQLQVHTTRNPMGPPGPLRPAEEYLIAPTGLDQTYIPNTERIVLAVNTPTERALGFVTLLGDKPQDL